MFKSPRTCIALSLIVAAAGVGVYYYITRAALEQSMPFGTSAPSAGTASAPRNKDIERNILHGVGSIDDLKPVPLQPAPQR